MHGVVIMHKCGCGSPNDTFSGWLLLLPSTMQYARSLPITCVTQHIFHIAYFYPARACAARGKVISRGVVIYCGFRESWNVKFAHVRLFPFKINGNFRAWQKLTFQDSLKPRTLYYVVYIKILKSLQILTFTAPLI